MRGVGLSGLGDVQDVGGRRRERGLIAGDGVPGRRWNRQSLESIARRHRETHAAAGALQADGVAPPVGAAAVPLLIRTDIAGEAGKVTDGRPQQQGEKEDGEEAFHG